MEQSKHTPGPWNYDDGMTDEPNAGIRGYPPYVFANCGPDSKDGEPVLVCDCREPSYEKANGDEGRVGSGIANARLIAAAPDLLAACKAAESMIETPGDLTPNEKLYVLEDLRAAIAKAEGRV